MTQRESEELLNTLVTTPVEVQRLAEDLSEVQTRWKPVSGEFSIIENICHLRDIELDGYTVRIKRILQEDQPFLADIDGARLADERDYNNQELSSAMKAFAKARQDNIQTIQGLSTEQLTRTGTLENTGSITLQKLLEMMREHDDGHLHELTALRGKLAQSA